MSKAPVIALLGAPHTGKSGLAHALAIDLRAQGWEVAVVGDRWREFREQAGRGPRREEHAPIAAEQTARIAEAASRHELVLADTTALMTALYCAELFQDDTLLHSSLQAQADCTLTLLAGLDLPLPPPAARDARFPMREAIDLRLRTLLQTQGLPFSVVYGRDATRAQHAARALQGPLQGGRAALPPSLDELQGPVRWRFKCQDCEQAPSETADCTAHALFRGLIS